MQYKFLILFIKLFLVPVVLWADEEQSITVLASSSMTDAITEVTRIYARERHITVTAQFGASSSLSKYIAQGEVADVFITSDAADIALLKQQGMIDVYSIINLVRNKIILVTAQDSNFAAEPIDGKSLETLVKGMIQKGMFVIPDPSLTPLGRTVEQLFTELDIWQYVTPYLIPSENVRNALYLIAKGKSSGIIYYTDAYHNPEVKSIMVIPTEPIIYQAAVVAGENMSEARGFVQFLKTKKASKIFEKYGFELLSSG